jgi:hypothetical protein
VKIIPNTRLLWGTKTLHPGVAVDLDQASAEHLIAEGVAVASEAEAPAKRTRKAATPETPVAAGDAPATNAAEGDAPASEA